MWGYNKHNNTFHKTVNNTKIEVPVVKNRYNEDSWFLTKLECDRIDSLLETWKIRDFTVSKVLYGKEIVFDFEGYTTLNECSILDTMDEGFFRELITGENTVCV